MTSPDREAIIRELFDRESARDFSGVVDMLDPDVEFELAYAPEFLEMPVRGRPAMLELFNHVIAAMFDAFVVTVNAVYPGQMADTCVVEYSSDGHVKHNGKQYRNRYVGIFKFNGDKIVFWREYHNTEEATRALS